MSRSWLEGAVIITACLAGCLPCNQPHLVRCVGQTRDPYSAMPFVPDVEADQQRCDLLDDACVLQLAAINRSYARDLRREFHRSLRGIRIIAAYDHVAIDIFIAVKHVCRDVVECRRDGNAL